jgi:hypothetical protein
MALPAFTGVAAATAAAAAAAATAATVVGTGTQDRGSTASLKIQKPGPLAAPQRDSGSVRSTTPGTGAGPGTGGRIVWYDYLSKHLLECAVTCRMNPFIYGSSFGYTRGTVGGPGARGCAEIDWAATSWHCGGCCGTAQIIEVAG